MVSHSSSVALSDLSHWGESSCIIKVLLPASDWVSLSFVFLYYSHLQEMGQVKFHSCLQIKKG